MPPCWPGAVSARRSDAPAEKRCWGQGGELPPDDVAVAIEGLEAAAEAAGVEVKDAAMRWMFSHAPLGAGDAVLMGALNPC